MATKPVMVMDPIAITGDPGTTVDSMKKVTSSSGLAVGSWFVPYWLIGALTLTVGALGVSFVVGGKKRKSRRRR